MPTWNVAVSSGTAVRAALALLAMLLAVGTPAADAGNASATRKQAESSMLVSGWVTTRPDGSVASHEIHDAGNIPAGVKALIDKAAAEWRFEPIKVDGQAVSARFPMHVRLVAKAVDKDRYTVDVRSATFGGPSEDPAERVTIGKLVPPQYPRTALKMGGKGTVYLLLRIGHDGRVEEVATEQVNLTVAGTSQQMDQLRALLKQASENAARRWTFKPPTKGPEATAPYWVGRIPVTFLFAGEKPVAAGEWETYIPGPRNFDIPWALEELRTAGSPDAMPDGLLAALKGSPRLLNPPGDGS